MRWLSLPTLLIMVALAPTGLAQTAPSDQPSNPADQKPDVSPELVAIQAQSDAFAEAFNRHDASAVAALWTDHAEFIDDSGTVYAGREAIEEAYAQYFAEHSDVQIQFVIDSLRQLGDNVAIEDGRAIVSPPPAGDAGVSKYTAVHTKVDGKWRMASVRDTWVEATVAPQSVADLEFLIGDWVAEEHGVQMHSVCRWIADRHFVARTYTTTHLDGSKTSGMQLIGWNPIAERMQSWMFSPDGGHAIGVWSATPAGWVAETIGTTGDGTPTTSLNRLSKLDDNAYVWQSIQRTAGGVALPDTDEVVIKRTSSDQ
ncbi:YybH family protein [Allorhodopirellula heiligendammensis]|nr:SgcJ/EcaC family oxidoreductase [Allorhodopirellula heiligendammensis]